VLSDRRRFRVLVVVGDFTHECLALVADTSLSSHLVVRELNTLIERRGKLLLVVSDNGTELTSRHLNALVQTSIRSGCGPVFGNRTRRILGRRALPWPVRTTKLARNKQVIRWMSVERELRWPVFRSSAMASSI
jgi:transposase InsO family protein